MADREKVMKGLECCLGSNDCDIEPKEDCPYKGMCLCAMALHLDVLALLKEQEAVKPVKQIEENEWTVCGHCRKHLISKWMFCPYCGRKVKWE